MPPIRVGSTNITKVYLGSTELDKVYVGSTEVFSSARPLPISLSGATFTMRHWGGGGPLYVPRLTLLIQTNPTTLGLGTYYPFNIAGYVSLRGSSNRWNFAYRPPVSGYGSGIGYRLDDVTLINYPYIRISSFSEVYTLFYRAEKDGYTTQSYQSVRNSSFPR